MAGVAGLEPVTSAVTGQRSNQLSYTPAKGDENLGNTSGGVKFCFGIFAGRIRLSSLRTQVVAAGILACRGGRRPCHPEKSWIVSCRSNPPKHFALRDALSARLGRRRAAKAGSPGATSWMPDATSQACAFAPGRLYVKFGAMHGERLTTAHRGAAENPPNRFEKIQLEPDPEWNPEDDISPRACDCLCHGLRGRHEFAREAGLSNLRANNKSHAS